MTINERQPLLSTFANFDPEKDLIYVDSADTLRVLKKDTDQITTKIYNYILRAYLFIRGHSDKDRVITKLKRNITEITDELKDHGKTSEKQESLEKIYLIGKRILKNTNSSFSSLDKKIITASTQIARSSVSFSKEEEAAIKDKIRNLSEKTNTIEAEIENFKNDETATNLTLLNKKKQEIADIKNEITPLKDKITSINTSLEEESTKMGLRYGILACTGLDNLNNTIQTKINFLTQLTFKTEAHERNINKLITTKQKQAAEAGKNKVRRLFSTFKREAAKSPSADVQTPPASISASSSQFPAQVRSTPKPEKSIGKWFATQLSSGTTKTENASNISQKVTAAHTAATTTLCRFRGQIRLSTEGFSKLFSRNPEKQEPKKTTLREKLSQITKRKQNLYETPQPNATPLLIPEERQEFLKQENPQAVLTDDDQITECFSDDASLNDVWPKSRPQFRPEQSDSRERSVEQDLYESIKKIKKERIRARRRAAKKS